MSGLENLYLKLADNPSPMTFLQDWIFWNPKTMAAESTNISKRTVSNCNKDLSQKVLHLSPGEVPSAQNQITAFLASMLAHPLTQAYTAHRYQQVLRQSSTRNLPFIKVLRQHQYPTVQCLSSHKCARRSNLRHCIMKLSTTMISSCHPGQTNSRCMVYQLPTSCDHNLRCRRR